LYLIELGKSYCILSRLSRQVTRENTVTSALFGMIASILFQTPYASPNSNMSFPRKRESRGLDSCFRRSDMG